MTWRRFSLRTLLATIALLAVFLSYRSFHIQRHRRAFAELVSKTNEINARQNERSKKCRLWDRYGDVVGPRFWPNHMWQEDWHYPQFVDRHLAYDGAHHIRLVGEQVSNDDIEAVGDLLYVYQVELWDTYVTADAVRHLPPSVRYLSIWGNDHDRQLLGQIKHLHDLRSLVVQNVDITDDHVSLLASLPRLEFVDVRGSEISATQATQLQSLLPDAEVRTH